MATRVTVKGDDRKAVITLNNINGHPSSTAILKELRRWQVSPDTHTITITYNPKKR